MQVSTFANAVWAPLLGTDTDVDNIEWGDSDSTQHTGTQQCPHWHWRTAQIWAHDK